MSETTTRVEMDQLTLRLPAAEKLAWQHLALDRGVSLTELILGAVRREVVQGARGAD